MPGVCVPYNRRSNCGAINLEGLLWTIICHAQNRTNSIFSPPGPPASSDEAVYVGRSPDFSPSQRGTCKLTPIALRAKNRPSAVLYSKTRLKTIGQVLVSNIV